LVPGLDRTFLIVNGDVLTDLDLGELVGFHRAHAAAMTIAARPMRLRLEQGVLDLNGAEVLAYREKPELVQTVSMGVYVCEPGVLRHLRAHERCDMPELVARALVAGERVRAYPTECAWLDVGRPADYALAQTLVEAHPERFGDA
jgi:NDP-sugar pyrophosphorylase family protein